MASEDLLKKAVAAFNALSPEQQAEMMEEQRQSWVRGNVGLSRDERGITSPMMRALKIVRDTNDKGRQALQAWADSKTHPTPVAPVSPDATCPHDCYPGRPGDCDGSCQHPEPAPDATGKCGELVTPELRQEIFELAKDLFWSVDGNQRLWSGEEREIYGLQAAMRIARSQAVELLAAERAKKEMLAESLHIQIKRVHELEAENAALTARVKELEKECDDFCADLNQERKSHESAHNRAEDLKAKLAAAEEVAQLVIQAEEDKSGDPNLYILLMQTAYDKARAALGGKPS